MNKETCVFEGCQRPAAGSGACDRHQGAAKAVEAGQRPRMKCEHGVPFVTDCGRCASLPAPAALRIDSDELHKLAAEMILRGLPAKLGPNGGVPLATHIGLPAADGRVYAVGIDGDRFTIHWGDMLVLIAAAQSGVIAYFLGIEAMRRRADDGSGTS